MTELPDCPGYVVLARRKDSNSLDWTHGPVEHSFSLDFEAYRTRFNWSSDNAVDNIFGKRWKVDGLKDSETSKADYEKYHPDFEFAIFDVHDPEIPVVIDWDYWRSCNAPADTLSGVRNKYGARNVRFKCKLTEVTKEEIE